MDLIIVRHGLPLRDEESSDPPLSERGHEQARAVSEFLQGEQIDHIVASTMIRAHETAMPLAEALGMEIELRDDIREVDEHRGQYIPGEEMDAESEFLQQWQDDPMFLFADFGGWEPWKERITTAFDDIIANNGGKKVAVFCHGMVMATMQCAILGLDTPFSFMVDYTGIARVQANSKGLRTSNSWNETQHARHLY